MDRVIAFKQIMPLVQNDQVGRPELVLFALDYTGALWMKQGVAGKWGRVEQPPDSTDTPYAATTNGVRD